MLDESSPDKKIEKQQDIYQRISLLGTGSFGKAFLVKEIKTQQLYVIKQINIADLDEGEQQKARSEAKILEALDHPNIIKFKQVYTTAKMKLNIVMEYAGGGDLAKKIAQAKQKKEYFQQQQILNWFTQICLGIKHIHDRKIIHRDLKGQNIFLTQDNCVKIGDLGVARVLQHTIAKAKTVVGSPYYLSPQIIENRPYSFKSDIWSLGALLFQMCSLSPPFTANNLQFLALKIVKGAYSNIPPQYSQDLRNLIRSMLNTNQNARPNISQILSSPLINRRIRNLLSQSKNIEEFSHTTLHKFNPIKKQVQDKLRPPPNLLQIEQEQIIQNLSSIGSNGANKMNLQQPQGKVKTPYVYGKNPPPIKKKVIQKKIVLPQNTIQNLSDIMQIKARPLEQQVVKNAVKITTPTVHVNKKRPETSKPISQQKVQISKPKNATSQAFNKRKSVDIIVKEINQIKKASEDNQTGRYKSPSLEEKDFDDKKMELCKNQIRNTEHKKTYPSTAVKQKSSSKKPKEKKQKQGKLQMVSEQMKQKQKIIAQKKVVKKQVTKKAKPFLKKPKVDDKTKKQVFEQQKCNAASDDKYEDEQFETYEQVSENQTTTNQDENNEQDLSFDLSDSSFLQQQQKQPSTNYKKMMSEMQAINKLVQQANGKVDNLPMLGQSIPQILASSSQIRQDDSDLQSEFNKGSTTALRKTQMGAINFACLSDQGELQNLRMALEEIFGIQNIIQVYQILSQIIAEKGLDFNEEDTIKGLLQKCPNIQQAILKKHFRLIATVITMENELQQNF